MNRIDPEFAFQARELAAQIEDTLGDPPNRKNYRMVVDALVQEFRKSAFIEDVNLLSFALVDHLQFNDPQSLLAAAKQYDEGNVQEVIALVSSTNSACTDMLAALMQNHAALVRQAIVVAFLHKHPALWIQDNLPPETDEEEDEDDTDTDETGAPTSEIVELFDPTGEDHGG
jgi:hypothetical protein